MQCLQCSAFNDCVIDRHLVYIHPYAWSLEKALYFTSMCSLAEESLAARGAVCFPRTFVTIAADDAEQLLAHLVTALAQLNRHHRHVGPGNGDETLQRGRWVHSRSIRSVMHR